MAENGTLELEEICQDSLEKDELSELNEQDALEFVSEAQEESLAGESGLDLQETTTNSDSLEGMKG